MSHGRNHNLLLHRTFQYLGIILIVGAIGGGYWYWKEARAGLNVNTNQNSALTNGLVGYWPFDGDDISGTTTYDRSGQGNNGTLTNGPTKAIGQIGQALFFDGSDDYVQASAGLSTAANTVSLWFKTNEIARSQVGIIETTSGGTKDTQPYLLLQNDAGTLKSYQYGAGYQTLGAIGVGTWYHIVLTRTTTNETAYINGVQVSSRSITTTGNNTKFNIGIGYNNVFQGSIDEPRVYNRALSASEIWDLYQMGAADKANSADSQGDSLEKGMVGYWKLDDASGTSATDSSGNANTGTLTNGPTWTTGQIGGGVDLDGTDDYVATSDINALDGLSNMSIGVWAKADVLSDDKTIISKSNSSADSNRFQLSLAGTGYGGNNDVTLSISDSSNQYAYTTEDIVATGIWNHYVIVFNGTQTGNANRLKLYQNGIQRSLTFGGGVTIPATTSASNAGIFQIGAETNHITNNRYWNGQIDEVRIYNRDLSADEVAKLYKQTAPDNPDTGLVGYWPFDGKDISGTTAYDRSGKGNNGTLTNSPTKTIGLIGQGIDFDGTNDYLDAGTGSSLRPSGPLSVSFWMYGRGSSTDAYMIGTGGSNLEGYSCTHHNGATVYCYLQNGTNYVSAPVGTNAWHHITLTWDGTTGTNSKKLYVNGVLANQGASTQGTLSGWGSFRMGQVASDNRTRFNGKLDEPRIYNRALSASEIWDLYQLGVADKVNSADSQIDSLEKGIVGYWKLDDGSGGTATDSSGNANTGTLTNGPTWTTGQIGGATDFDGTDDYITASDSGSLDSTSNITVSVWANADNWTGETGISTLVKKDLNYILRKDESVSFGGSGLKMYWWDGTNLLARRVATLPTTGAWHHIVGIVENNATVRIYVDGILQAGTDYSASSTRDLTVNLSIGNHQSAGTESFDGKMDEVRIYNRALSADEVAKLYKTTAPDDPDTGLVGYWPFDGKDISGTTAYDRSRIGKNATLVNGASATIGKVGQGINLDGSNDYLSVVDDVSQHFGTGDFTYSFWVYLNDTSQGVLFSNGTYVDGIMFYRYDSGTTYLWIANANGQSSAWNPPARTWQHVVLRRASGTVYMYANGVQQFTLGLSGNVTDVSASGMRIGYGFAGSANVVMNGKIDEFRMYNRALSTAEIAALYSAGR